MLKLCNLRKSDYFVISVLLSSLAIFGSLACTVAGPAYTSPQSRSYDSNYGYPNLLRKSNKPLSVSTDKVKTHLFLETHLGEGSMASQAVLVPVIPMSKVNKLHVKEGQTVKKGDLLLEMDESLAQIKLSSAQLALQTATAELGRVNIGSAYVLAQERPDKDKIDFNQALKQVEISREKAKRHKALLAKGAISRDEYLELELRLSEAVKELDRAKFNLSMSTKGQKQSINIADNAVKEAKNNLQHRTEELKSYKIYAPASGIIERVLIREGEYNQDSGRPAFVIASGLWFEAHLDQTAINKVKVGDEANVFLEALTGKTIKGKVEHIKPIVNYNAGGPEINRPIRPRGSGTPEWPSTFEVRIKLDDIKENLYPGLTGFAKISTSKKALSIKRAALTSLSTTEAIVKVPKDNSFSLQSIRTGSIDDSRVEIVSGLEEGDEVISNGQASLQSGDLVKLEN